MSQNQIVLVANTGWYLYNFRFSLAQKLIKQGYRVTFVSPSDEYVHYFARAGCQHIPWQVNRRFASLFGELRAIERLAEIYRTVRPFLVHHFTIKPVLYGSFAAKYARVPKVVNSITGRGYVFLEGEKRPLFLTPLVHLMYRLAYFRLNAVSLFENEYDMQFFIRSGLIPQKNTWLINGAGVNTSVFCYKPEQTAAVPMVVFPGRLLWSKGVDTLIAAARLLRERVKVRMVLVGKPDSGNPSSVTEQDIQNWVAEDLVEWWGWESDMPAVYQQAHVVVLPSLGEGLSKALLEAASCGRPIITTDVPGCRDLVQNGVNGFLIPPGNAAVLADRIEQLAHSPELRQAMGLAGRELIERKYSEEIVDSMQLAVYQRFMGEV